MSVVKKILQKLLKYLIPLIIGVGLFYFLYKNVNFNEMMSILRSDVNYFWIGVMLVITVFSHIFRAYRWRLQLRAIDIDAPISALINSIFGTYAVNLIFPRLGEVWRCGYIAERQKSSFTKVVGSMVADRMSDTIMVLFLTVCTFFIAQDAFYKFLYTYPQIKDGLWNILVSPITWIGLLVIIGILVWLFTHKTENKLINKLKTMFANLWQGFYAVTKMKGKWWFFIYTFLIWGCYFTQLYVATFAFDFPDAFTDVRLKATLVLFVLSSIGMGIPTNGGLGAWHLAIIFGLSLYGLGPFVMPYNSSATAFAMLVWGIGAVLLILLGIYAFIYMEVDRRHIKEGKTIVRTKGTGIKL